MRPYADKCRTENDRVRGLFAFDRALIAIAEGSPAWSHRRQAHESTDQLSTPMDAMPSGAAPRLCANPLPARQHLLQRPIECVAAMFGPVGNAMDDVDCRFSVTQRSSEPGSSPRLINGNTSRLLHDRSSSSFPSATFFNAFLNVETPRSIRRPRE